MNQANSKENLVIIKISGNIIDDEARLENFLKDLSAVQGHKILVHGGGVMATQMAKELGIGQKMIEGRRITDKDTLKIVTMVYAGYINKKIVALLQSNQSNALGLTGADGNCIKAHKRINANLDYGFVGDVDEVKAELFNQLLCDNILPVIAPITHNGEGQLLNTNADTIAQEIARSLSDYYNVQLLYTFEKPGVLLNMEDEATVITHLHYSNYQQLKSKGLIFAGMIPKLDNAFAALNSGVQKITIGSADHLTSVLNGKSGTTILKDE